jgi:hypothetical protein
MKNKLFVVIIAGLWGIVSLNAMDTSVKTISTQRKRAQFASFVLFEHIPAIKQLEKDENAAKIVHYRTGQLSPNSPLHNKLSFDNSMIQESYTDILVMLTHPKSELPNGYPLARQLLKVYNGDSAGFFFDQEQYPHLPLRKVIGMARWLGEKGGNREFLVEYQATWDPCYEIRSPRSTFSSSSSDYSSSSLDD